MRLVRLVLGQSAQANALALSPAENPPHSVTDTHGSPLLPSGVLSNGVYMSRQMGHRSDSLKAFFLRCFYTFLSSL